MKEEFQKVCSYFYEHPAIFISLIFSYISILGLLFKVCFFKHLGLNAFDFLVASDFLISFLKGLPVLFIAAIFHSVLVVITLLGSQKFDKGKTFRLRFKNTWLKVRYTEFFITFLLSFFLAMLAGKLSSKYFYEAFIQCYQIETKLDNKEYNVIQSSANYLYTINNQIINIIPRSQILSLSTCHAKE